MVLSLIGSIALVVAVVAVVHLVNTKVGSVTGRVDQNSQAIGRNSQVIDALCVQVAYDQEAMAALRAQLRAHGITPAPPPPPASGVTITINGTPVTTSTTSRSQGPSRLIAPATTTTQRRPTTTTQPATTTTRSSLPVTLPTIPALPVAEEVQC